MTPRDLFITNPDKTKSYIDQEKVTVSKKTLGIHDFPAGGNKGHLKYIQQKASTWTSRMTNGHLPHHMAWIAYKLQLWPGIRYELGTMTNDIEEAASVNTKIDYKMLNFFGGGSHSNERSSNAAYNLWRIRLTQRPNRAADMSNQYVVTTLSYFHKSQQKT